MSQELLTVDQFAQRLQISRATVFVWIQKNILNQGKHYLKIGRVLRFIWPADLLETISQASTPVKAAPALPRQKKGSPLNWDY